MKGSCKRAMAYALSWILVFTLCFPNVSAHAAEEVPDVSENTIKETEDGSELSGNEVEEADVETDHEDALSEEILNLEDNVSKNDIFIPDDGSREEGIEMPEISAEPEESVKTGLSGSCGANVTWSYDADTEVLNICGTGKMEDYESDRLPTYYKMVDVMSIKEVVIEEGVTHIGDWAFKYFPAAEFHIPSSVDSIGKYAFYCAGSTSIIIPEGVTSIGGNAFVLSKLTDVIIPDSVTCIGSFAFDTCYALTSVHIGKNVCSMGVCPFGACEELTDISVDPENAHYADQEGVLFNKDMTSLIQFPAGRSGTYAIPAGVVTIEAWAFNRCNCSVVEIPSSVMTIEEFAFSYSYGLSSVQIPYSVSCIYRGAFDGCRKLSEIYFHGDAPRMRTGSLGWDIFDNVTADAYYPRTNPTWGAEDKQDYGGTLTWRAWDSYTPAPEKRSITACDVGLSQSFYSYNGTANRPAVTVKDGAETLIQGVDYSVAYSDNVNATKAAKVTITGIGRYTGTTVKTFTIYKIYQQLTANISADRIKAGSTSKITASAVGAVTYKSEDPKVATVSALGVVTGVAVGNTDIVVTANETDNYYPVTKTFSVTVTQNAVFAPASLGSLTYSFSNSAASFGYGSGYSIPLERYQMFFSDAQAKQKCMSAGKWGGNCYGMSSSASMFNTADSTLMLSKFNSAASRVSDLAVLDRNISLNLNIREVIEALQVSQQDEKIQRAYNYNTDLDTICRAVKDVESGEPPVILAVWGASSNGSPAGHAIVGYKAVKVDSNTMRLYVYDCNYPKTERYITVSTNSSGHCTGWRYEIDPYTIWGSGRLYSDIAYVPYTAYQAVWEGRRTNLSTMVNTMTVNTDDLEIQDLNGKVIATMSEGEFLSEKKEIYPCRSTETEEGSESSHLIYMPTDAYRIINKDPSGSGFEISMVNVEQSAKVTTEADQIEIYLDDRQEVNLVNIDAPNGEAYEVSMTSSLDCVGEKGEVGYSGAGGNVTVGTSAGQCVMDGYGSTSMTVNGKTVNVENADYERDISTCDISLADAVSTYDGESKVPEVIVKDGSATLISERDYVVVCKNNTQAGTAAAVVYGIGRYSGQTKLDFTIEKLDLSACTVTLDTDKYIYDGEEKCPYIEVKSKNVSLKNGIDYTVTYKDNKNPGTAYATIAGIGSCTGSIEKKFTITTSKDGKIDISKCTITLRTSGYIYDGYAKTPSVEVKNDRTVLKAGTDYTVTYKNNKMPGTASAAISGKGDYTGTVSKNFKIKLATPGLPKLSNTAKGVKISWKGVKGATGHYIYRKAKGTKKWKNIGKASGKTSSFIDSSARSNGSKYTYTIQAYYDNGKGSAVQSDRNGSGKSIYYLKTLASPSLKSTKNRKLVVKWKKKTKVSGYQIQYSSRKDFKGAKTKNISSGKNSFQTSGKLKKGKSYYVRIRSYKKNLGKKYYSAWSVKGKIKIR